LASEIKELLQDLFTATQILVNEKVLDGFGIDYDVPARAITCRIPW